MTGLARSTDEIQGITQRTDFQIDDGLVSNTRVLKLSPSGPVSRKSPDNFVIDKYEHMEIQIVATRRNSDIYVYG